MLADLKAPRKTFKDQIKQLHPSCASGALTKLSTPGVEYVECILGCFCKVTCCLPLHSPASACSLTGFSCEQEIVEELQSLAHGHGKTSSKKEESKKTITNDWLKDEALPALREPTLRLLLALEPRGDPAASRTSGTGGRAAVSGGEGATVSNMASVPRAGGGSGAGGGASPSTGEEGGVRDGHGDTETENDDDAEASGGESQGAVQHGEGGQDRGGGGQYARGGTGRAAAAEGIVQWSAGEDAAFSSQHLAEVLLASFATMEAMRDFLNRLKNRSEAFIPVQFPPQPGGARVNSLEQIAAKIAECKPEQVASAGQLLSWLTMNKKLLLSKDNLRAAMATRSIRYVSRDKIDALLKKVVTSWPHTTRGAQMGNVELERAATAAQDPAGAGSPAAVHSHPAGSDSPEDSDGEARASSSSVAIDSSSLGKRSLEAGHGSAPSGNGVRRSGGEGGVGGEGGASSRSGGVGSVGAGGGGGGGETPETDDEGESSGDRDAAHDASRANGSEPVTFSSEHLAQVLCAALRTKVAMKALVRDVKAKDDAFRMVQQSSQADGAYTNMQIAETIAKCRPAQVSNASELLSWLVKVCHVSLACRCGTTVWGGNIFVDNVVLVI
jgi:hypothetical protein